MRRLAQGHLYTQLGGAEDRTSKLPVTSHPALPPEPHAKPPDMVRHGDIYIRFGASGLVQLRSGRVSVKGH